MFKIIKKILLSFGSLTLLGLGIGAYYIYKWVKDKPNKKNNNEELQNNAGYEANNSDSKIKLSNDVRYYKPQNVTRVGHWNILNFGGDTSNKGGLKVTAISQAIIKTKLDLVGLTEINYDDGDKVDRILKTLNELDSKSKWKSIIQPISDSNPSSNNATKEQIAILYKSTVLTPEKFNSDKIGASFGTEKANDEKNVQRSFKRPIFGVLFKDNLLDKKITTIFGHLDSPDVKKNSDEQTSKYSGQGTQEVFEASRLANAFDYFEKLTNQNSSIIFGGDTNIKTQNNELFLSSDFKSRQIINYYDDMRINQVNNVKSYNKYEYYETSLGSKKGYANAYDKILFKENNLNIITEAEKLNNMDIKYRNSWFKLDLINSFNDGFFDKNQMIKLWKQSPAYKTHENYKDFEIIRSQISDHTLVWVDYEK
ncbi:hypothetical protein JXZ92_01175 [Mycoplasma sp. CSL10137]|uniref:MnuA family membrane nuclease n=1 Tax=Mycoplasma sp. CSL10137 TaxID=2813824 RepID=UPI00197B1719|nr:hypothetical protein [Mycoplasma sp. CSL10137]MBN4083434.1 hypothetical protein [Mycoplasma sp. CSL10137]